jgi:poly(A) polymerase
VHLEQRIYSPGEHNITQDLIDTDALWVLSTLAEAGHTAYLVGGGVRDLLLGRRPKDFDICTSAEPEEVKAIFRRRCLLIGRRFRLAHIRFGAKVIEVATFRSGDINDTDLIVRDNEWGTAEEDALRRDFTINGLYYCSEKNQVIDYVGGVDDLKQGLIRTIGTPVLRFKQDPVRMLRLLKFQARFGLRVDLQTHDALVECVDEITKSSPARILEEIFRMLESGASEPFFRMITDHGFLDHLFPSLADFFRAQHGPEVYQLLRQADLMIQEGTQIERPVLAACLIYPILLQELAIQERRLGRVPHMGDIITVTHSLIHAIVSTSFFQFPRRMRILIGFVLTSQFRITPLPGVKARYHKLLSHRDFHLALGFLQLRARLDESLDDTVTEIASNIKPREEDDRRGRRNKRRRPRRRSPRKS